jgi:hypothetical protein
VVLAAIVRNVKIIAKMDRKRKETTGGKSEIRISTSETNPIFKEETSNVFVSVNLNRFVFRISIFGFRILRLVAAKQISLRAKACGVLDVRKSRGSEFAEDRFQR